MQTSISPFEVDLSGSVLSFIREGAPYASLNISVDDDFLVTAECADKYEYFEKMLVPRIKEDLQLEDLQIEVLKNFLDESGYFNK